MAVLVTRKNEEDPIKMKALEWSPHSRAANSTVQGLIWPNFKPFRDFMGVLVACKNEEKPNKKEAFIVVLIFCKNEEDTFNIASSKVITTFLPL